MPRPLWLLLLSVAANFSVAGEIPWRKGYEAFEGSESPDGRYGLVIPDIETGENLDPDKIPNYLADLKQHRLLGTIPNSHYFRNRNHSGLSAIWASDSSWCVVDFERRFGFDTLTLLEIEGATFTQTDIGARIHQALDAVIAKEAHKKEIGGDGSVYFRLSEDRKLRVRATGATNPKALEGQKTYVALFQGTFDLKAKKWTVMDARPIDADLYEVLLDVYGDLNLAETSFTNDKDKLQWLDERLNEVYRADRLLLPAEKFAKIKQEQVAWLKTRDAASSDGEKCRLLEARVKALRDTLW